MSNFSPVLEGDCDPQLNILYQEIRAGLGCKTLPNWVTYLGNNYINLKSIWVFFKEVTTSKALSGLLKELIVFAVSYKSGSSYCAEFHASEAIKLSSNLDFNQLKDIVDGQSNGYIPDRYITAITFAVAHSQSKCNLTDEGYNALLEQGFEHEEIQEIFSLCALALAFNSFTKGMNIPIDKSHKVEGFCV